MSRSLLETCRGGGALPLSTPRSSRPGARRHFPTGSVGYLESPDQHVLVIASVRTVLHLVVEFRMLPVCLDLEVLVEIPVEPRRVGEGARGRVGLLREAVGEGISVDVDSADATGHFEGTPAPVERIERVDRDDGPVGRVL